MKSELSFLMDLFLNDEVPQPIKKMVADRIREVETMLTVQPVVSRSIRMIEPLPPSPIVAAQSPSMQRIMEANPDVPVTTVAPAVSPAAQAALAQRAAIINSGMKEKPEPGRTSPRKF
jgi:hypothetical protein